MQNNLYHVIHSKWNKLSGNEMYIIYDEENKQKKPQKNT